MTFFSKWLDLIIKIANENVKNIICEPCKNPKHGDISCNILLVLDKNKDKNALKQRVVSILQEMEEIETVDVAGPGFLNIKFTTQYWQGYLKEIFEQKETYGTRNIGEGKKVNVEFVSTNPTGPLHVGHGRNAVLGDCIARLLERMGYQVVREYYINDAGGQVDNLGRSVYMRYLQILGKPITDEDFSKDMYPGDYIIPIAQIFYETHGDKFIDKIDDRHVLETFKDFAVSEIMNLIKADLQKININFDSFVSEKKIIEQHKVDFALSILEQRGDLYTGILEKPEGHEDHDWDQREQTLFRSTKYGDDKDRALTKKDGSWTYFASDIAYHLDKIERGYHILIDVWGADHFGYIKRMKASVAALTDGYTDFQIKICQMVNFLENGKPFRMSKRSGMFLTIADVVEHIGIDAFRFMLLTRQNDVAFDFDFKYILEKTKDNPVFYVQYAFARIASVKRRFNQLCEEKNWDYNILNNTLHLLTEQEELSIIKLIASWPRQVELSTLNYEPHRITNYLYNLAGAFHSLWSQGRGSEYRFLDGENYELTIARLCLLEMIQSVIKNGLDILGVTVREEM